jgi:DDE family transposase
MASYARRLPLVKTVCPFLRATQAVNFTWLVVALLSQRTLCLTTLAKAFPRPPTRRTAAPKHELLHRLKRLSRFLSNAQVDPVALQVAFIPTVLARLGNPRQLGLVLDWTSFDTKLLGLTGGGRRPYQVLTIAIPRRGRALPLLSVTYERDKLPAKGSQNKWEEEALAHVLRALPLGVRPVVLGDRAFGRAEFIAFLQKREVDYVLRLKRGARITEADDRHWLLGTEGTRIGEQRWLAQVRYGTFNNRPRALTINLACSWCPPAERRRDKTGKEYQEPWYLATSLGSLREAVAWYHQRMWVEETFKDFHSGFGLDATRVSTAGRLGRLVAALTVAVAWLHLLALPEVGLLPRTWAASVVTYGRASSVALALAWFDEHDGLPTTLLALPRAA